MLTTFKFLLIQLLDDGMRAEFTDIRRKIEEEREKRREKGQASRDNPEEECKS